MSRQSLGDFFAEQVGDGVAEAGAFTVNQARAIELMKRYQLKDRRSYVLKLVQWAVASGATLIDVKTSSSRVDLSHNGLPVTAESLEAVVKERVEFGHLPRGLYGAVGLDPEEVTLTSAGKRISLISGRVECLDDQLTNSVTVTGLSKGIFETSPMVRAYLRKRWLTVGIDGALQRLIWDATGLRGLEAALIRNLCSFCHVPLRLNGKFINRPGGANYRYQMEDDGTLRMTISNLCFGSRLFAFHIGGGSELLAPLAEEDVGNVLWVQGTEKKRPDNLKPLPHMLVNGKAVYAAHGFTDHYLEGLSTRYFFFIQDGVIIDDLQEPAKIGGLAVFSASGLKTAVDGFELVRDEAFSAHLEDIRERINVGNLEAKEQSLKPGIRFNL